jgi:hypothetical protein
MPFIEVDKNVFNKLQKLAEHKEVTANEILKSYLTQKKKKTSKGSFIKNGKTIIEDELIPYITKILFNNGNQAPKQLVEKKVFEIFKDKFNEPYFQETVSHGVPRWKHFIAWAKERAKQRHGYIKSAKESGRGIWELTHDGILYAEKELDSLILKN